MCVSFPFSLCYGLRAGAEGRRPSRAFPICPSPSIRTIGQHKTALEIRDFLSGEFTPLPLADLMAVLHAREAAGTLKLVPKAGK